MLLDSGANYCSLYSSAVVPVCGCEMLAGHPLHGGEGVLQWYIVDEADILFSS